MKEVIGESKTSPGTAEAQPGSLKRVVRRQSSHHPQLTTFDVAMMRADMTILSIRCEKLIVKLKDVLDAACALNERIEANHKILNDSYQAIERAHERKDA